MQSPGEGECELPSIENVSKVETVWESVCIFLTFVVMFFSESDRHCVGKR